jgi:hypothetical protein
MPYKMKKVKGGKYQTSGPSGVHAKGTTKGKAEAQLRLLRGIEHGMVPRKSVKGSAPFTAEEICQGYRKI